MYLWFVLPTTLYTAFFRALPQILFDIFCPALLIHDMRCPNLNCLISSYPIPSPIYFYSVLISSVITNSEILYLFQQWNDIKRQIFEWIRSNQFTTATGYSWFINSQTIHNCVHQCLKQNIHETFISFLSELTFWPETFYTCDMHVFFKYLLKPTSRASPNEAVNARSTAKKHVISSIKYLCIQITIQ
jgi:hypothetical protein